MIVLDLEWNSGYNHNLPEEVLQIGAVKLDRLGGRVLDTFNGYIRPRIHRKFSPAAKKLPDLALSLEGGRSFRSVMNEFREWCGDETEFATWGGSQDFGVLRKNCEFYHVKPINAEKMYDFQHAFSTFIDIDNQLALGDAIDYCGIPAPFDFHNAMYDALYTAMMGERMGIYATSPKVRPRRIRGFSGEEFEEPARQRIGPFDTPEAMLNSRSARRPSCPICGESRWVELWYTKNRLRWFAVFRCPEHGKFICRLTLAKFEDGQYRGRLTVPEITPKLLRAFDAAVNASGHKCKPLRRRRRRRYSAKK